MGMHPYPFKWRIFRRFGGLLVMIIRHMKDANELDGKIAGFASDIDILRKGLGNLQREERLAEVEEKKGKKVKNWNKEKMIITNKINKKIKGIRKNVNSFCKNVREELKNFSKNDVDNATLLYRGTKYLKHLAELMSKSKNMDVKSKAALKKGIEAEMKSLERKVGNLDLQAKHLGRGGINTVVFSEISPWGNRWIERRIRIKAIEAKALYDRLKDEGEKDLFEDFEREIMDLYEIGRNTGVLMRRLKITFNSMRARLKETGISFPGLDKTQEFFESTFRRIEKIGKWLENEIKGQASELSSELKDA